MLTLDAARLHVAKDIELEKWDEVVREFPNHTIFHTSAWLKTIMTAHAARAVLVAVEQEGEWQAIWPNLETRKGLLRIIGSPLPGWSTAYMGPLFRQDADVTACLDALLSHRSLRNPAFFACKVLSEEKYIDLEPYGFQEVLQFDTYCVDVTQSEETMWGNLKGECRTRVRKAQKLGLEVREEPDDGFMEEYWTMSLETFANTHIQPTFTRQFADEMWKNLRAEGRIRALSAWQNGERIGTLVLPFDHHTMYYWGGASYIRYRGIPAHNLLHWHGMLLAKSLGLRRYDFISTVGGAGRFKKTFGPDTIPISTHWERCQSKLVAMLKRGYENYLLAKRRVKS